jgi:hypothetical protein
MIMDVVASVIVGVVFIALGIRNHKGNISSLHSYHRDNVKEEDKIPFGKAVGLGMLIIGGALIVNGALSLVTYIVADEVYMLIGKIVMTVGLLVGIIGILRATKKYNGKIF